MKALQELLRILTPGGQALIYVWAFEQELDKKKSNYLKESRREQKEAQKQDIPHPLLDTTDLGQKYDGQHEMIETPSESVGTEFTASSITTAGSIDVISAHRNSKAASSSDVNPIPPHQHGSTAIADSCSEKAAEEISTSQTDKISIHTNRTSFKEQDMLVPWTLKENQNASSGQAEAVATYPDDVPEDSKPGASCGSVYHRYYHLFRKGELEDMCSSVSGTEIIQSYYDKGNWCVIVQKTKA